MYEQKEMPVWRRVLWIVLGAVVVVAIVWALVWLIFIRDNSPKAPAIHSKDHHQTQTSDTSKSGNATQNNSSSSKQSTQPSGTPSQSSNSSTPPQTLANTGPGNILAPVFITSVVGSTFYYIRLRRKIVK